MSCRKTLGAIVFAAVAGFVPAAVGAQDFGPSGVYRLTEINADPLPVVIDIDEDGRCREELVSAALTLGVNGNWSLVSREREVCYGDLVKEIDEEIDEGMFVVDGSTITFFDEHGELVRDRILELDIDDFEIDDLEVGTLSRNAVSVRLETGVVAIFRR